ncbi:hypothetical protein ACFLR5_02200 [Elusimicrobiota bacterium]
MVKKSIGYGFIKRIGLNKIRSSSLEFIFVGKKVRYINCPSESTKPNRITGLKTLLDFNSIIEILINNVSAGTRGRKYLGSFPWGIKNIIKYGISIQENMICFIGDLIFLIKTGMEISNNKKNGIPKTVSHKAAVITLKLFPAKSDSLDSRKGTFKIYSIREVLTYIGAVIQSIIIADNKKLINLTRSPFFVSFRELMNTIITGPTINVINGNFDSMPIPKDIPNNILHFLFIKYSDLIKHNIVNAAIAITPKSRK